MVKKLNKSNFYRKLTIFIIIVGIVIRFALASIYTISGDACWQFSISRFLAENKKFPLFEQLGRQEPFWAPPLFHIMLASLYSLFGIFGFGVAEFSMKMLSPLFGSLTLIFVYLINKKLFNEKVTFYSMLFTTFIPIFMDYGILGYVDGAVTFFVTLSIYFALNDRYVKSSIAAGLAALTKYNGIFILPLLIYIIYKNTANKKLLIKRLSLVILVPIIIAAPWFMRNYIGLGNPFWPFLNFLLKEQAKNEFVPSDFRTFDTFNPLNIFSPKAISFTYLAIFGVPDGNYKNFFFFDIPYIKVLLTFWLLGTLFFLMPFVKGFNMQNKLKSKILLIWILCYLAVLFLYISNVAWGAARFLLPAIPALGMVYGNGLSKIDLKNKILRILFYTMLFIIIIGFIATESIKIKLASREWKLYKNDFEWVRQHTSKEDVIIPGYQCLAYYLNRVTLYPAPDNLKKANYVWVNENFNLEIRSIISNEILKEIEENNFEKVYENKKTGTSIYKVKR